MGTRASAVEASEGAVGKEVSTIVKPGAGDKWVHSYWDGARWEPWQGAPFMREGRVDLGLLRKANKKRPMPTAVGKHIFENDTVQREGSEAVGW